jgi:hypothetical protein
LRAEKASVKYEAAGGDARQRCSKIGVKGDAEQDQREPGCGRYDQRVSPPFACNEDQQHERIIFEQACGYEQPVREKTEGPRRGEQDRAADHQQENDEIIIGAFQSVDGHWRNRRRAEDKQLPGGAWAQHDSQ